MTPLDFEKVGGGCDWTDNRSRRPPTWCARRTGALASTACAAGREYCTNGRFCDTAEKARGRGDPSADPSQNPCQDHRRTKGLNDAPI